MAIRAERFVGVDVLVGHRERVLILVCSFLFLTFSIAVIAGTLYKMHKNRLLDSLKRELLDRVLGADEIATIVSGHPAKARAHQSRTH